MSGTLSEHRQIVSASVPASLARQVAELAAAADRSLSAEVRRALRRHVDQPSDVSGGASDKEGQ
jgi:hypothetical protein